MALTNNTTYDMQYLTIGDKTYKLVTDVTFTRTLSTGTKIGTININNVSTDIFAPTPVTYESKSAIDGGTDVSLVTTGEKYIWNQKTSNAGTVTSITITQGTGISISNSGTAIVNSGERTISLANNYGDSKNPYASKTKNYVLAAPSNANGVPSFRALVAADIPDLSEVYLTSFTEADPVFSASAAADITSTDISNWNSKTSNVGTITKITTTAGKHTVVNTSSGAVSFNVPTTAAHVNAATDDHTHGNITNSGDITATAPTIGNGDQLIINDHSASKITNGPTFDGSTTTQALTKAGTWENFNNYSHPTYTAIDAAAVKVGRDATGHVVIGSALTAEDIGAVDEKVKQQYSTSNANYPLLFSNTSGITSTSTRGATTALLNNAIYVNPQNGDLHATKFNGLTLAAASEKGVDTTISPASTSTNLPTSAAVAAFVEGKNYKTTDTTYTLTNALSQHTFTWTFTPLGDDATTTTIKLVAGTGIELTDNTTNKEITIKAINNGTVTKVTAGAGLKVDNNSSGGFISSEGTIAHINSITAQTTRAIYPIEIDAQGHISAYGDAIIPLTTVESDGNTGNVITGLSASNGKITYTLGTVSTTAAQIVRW